MAEQLKTYYTFDDVALIPQYSNVNSRLDTKLNTKLTKKITMKIPIVDANMDTVICERMAYILLKNGSVTIFHRFCSFKRQRELVKKFKNECFVSYGLNDLENLYELLEKGALGVCLDVAHGHCKRMVNAIKQIKKKFPDKEIIAGNVCNPMGCHDLIVAGADAIKVGIGPGSACSTRIITGFGAPQFSAIKECAKVCNKMKIPLIADGGIRNSRDIVLALAAGADSVMIGSLFAKTYESAARKMKKNNGTFAVYRGQASKEFQEDFYGELKENTVAEGVQYETKCESSCQELIDNLCGGIRSGLTYGGSTNIEEFREKAEFVRVTSTYMKESFPRTSQ